MQTITAFDTSKHHIYLRCWLSSLSEAPLAFLAVLDTGAFKTEISADFLVNVGILRTEQLKPAHIKTNQQTQKIGKLVLPAVDICGQSLTNFEVFISHFESGWGIDALIGLDFFRRFKVEIDYSRGEIRTESFSSVF